MSKIEHGKRFVLRNRWGNSDHKHYGKYLSFNKNDTICFCDSDDLENIVPWELYESHVDPISEDYKSPYYLINRWGSSSDGRYGKYLSFGGNTIEFCDANDRHNWVPWDLEKVPNTTNQYYVKNQWIPPSRVTDDRYGKYLSFSGNTINLCDADDQTNKVPWELLEKIEITQKQLKDFKALHPNNCCEHDDRINGLTFEDVRDGTKYHFEDWNNIDIPDDKGAKSTILNQCQIDISFVVYDAIILAINGSGLLTKNHEQAAIAVGEAVLPVMSGIETIIHDMAGASPLKQAEGVFKILDIIWKGGYLGAVFSAITDSLTWWDMIFYGISGTGTVIAALATDGVAIAAEWAVVIADVGFLTSDIEKVIQNCR